MPDISISPGANLEQVKRLLVDCNLADQDLTSAHMDNFVSLYKGDQLIGCIGLEIFEGAALLRSLAVESGSRGQGLGAQLLAAAESQAASRGVRMLYLLTTTAEAFFARRGYVISERSRALAAIQQTSEFRSLCPSTAVCMNKRLANHDR
jgi:amino-acid N-acetyltransferase